MPNSSFNIKIGNDGRFVQVNNSLLADRTYSLVEAAEVVISGRNLASAWDHPISDLAVQKVEAEIAVSHEWKWNIRLTEGANLLVRLDPSAQSVVRITRSGEIFQAPLAAASDAEPASLAPPVPAPDPKAAYVSVCFEVNLSVAAHAKFSHGAFGLQVGADHKRTYLLAYHHRVDMTTKVGDAVVQAFESFVFPYDVKSAERLGVGCFSEWEHTSNLDCDLKISFGFDGARLGGLHLLEVERTYESALGKAALAVRPRFDLGAFIAVNYEHFDMFRSVLSAPSESQRELFLYKANQRRRGLQLGVNASVRINAQASVESQLHDVIQSGVESLLPPAMPNREETLKRVEKALSDNEISRAAKDIERAIQSELKKLERGSFAFVASMEKSEHSQALLALRFLRDQDGALPPEYAAAFEGRMEVKTAERVELLAGSFVCSSLQRRASVKLQLFGLLGFTHIETYVRSSQLVYEGDGVFSLVTKTGRSYETARVGRRKNMEFCFTVASKFDAAGKVSGADWRMCIAMTDENDPDGSHRTAEVLRRIIRHEDHSIADRMKVAVAENPKLRTRLVCLFGPSAFQKLSYTRFEIPESKPAPLPHGEDAENYAAFVEAVDALMPEYMMGEGFPDAASRYQDWAQFNVAVNAGPDTVLACNSRPNRRRSGNLAVSNWPQHGQLAAVKDDSKRRFIIVCLEAARMFMNICEDLATLCNVREEWQSEKALKMFVSELDSIIRENALAGSHPLFFGKATLAALVRRMNPQLTHVEGPAAGTDSGDEFLVKLQFA